MRKYDLREMVKADSKKALTKAKQERKSASGRTETGQKPDPVELQPERPEIVGIRN
jgi:hypothetical protein